MSSISKAVHRAYKVMEERNWDTIYWCIDLHGVCLKSNYKQGGYKWINKSALSALKTISNRKESKIILWSSVFNEEKAAIVKFFKEQGISVYGFNSNPFEANTKVSDFSQKFYFSILLDDKAGFDPEVDWSIIETYLKGITKMETLQTQQETQSKPVVQYIKETAMVNLGMMAIVDTVDHPSLGATTVHTTKVIRIEPNTGVFETKNTIYKPVIQLNG